jgi:succinate dehydrogenase / fumarate reductase flavoprotein subunit
MRRRKGSDLCLRGSRYRPRKEKGSAVRHQMQETMTELASVFRQEDGLGKGIDSILALKQRLRNVAVTNKGKAFNYELTETIELKHQLDLCEVVLTSALCRRESRGAHYRQDYPARDDEHYLKHTLAFATEDGSRIGYKPVTLTRFEPRARTY